MPLKRIVILLMAIRFAKISIKDSAQEILRRREQSQKFENEKLQASKPNSNEEKRNSLRNSELPKPFPYRIN